MSIEVKNLSFSYGKKQILHDISFRAEKGEFLSVLGPNGAGKSTLFRCILGLLPDYSGEVLINGHDIKNFSAREASRQIAYIPQNSTPTFHYSVLDIVLMGRTNRAGTFGNPGKEDEQASLAALEKIGIGALKNRSFHKLSGGEQQLVLIARALAQDAPVLLLDEPTASLDYGNQILVLEQAKKLSAEGYTVIQTTHHPEQSYLYSDRILALQNGRIIADGKPCEVLTTELMKELYHAQVGVVSLFDDAARVCIPAEFIDQKGNRQ
ncbi:MAG: ABC transporter ATP-binding protein [Oscillospiraceae bacterium]|nr:ABC transporter ATP-binding protein [Oscillospiraceae bacterium]